MLLKVIKSCVFAVFVIIVILLKNLLQAKKTFPKQKLIHLQCVTANTNIGLAGRLEK